jgi:hypothetical protein
MAISLGIFDSSSENRVFSSLEQRLVTWIAVEFSSPDRRLSAPARALLICYRWRATKNPAFGELDCQILVESQTEARPRSLTLKKFGVGAPHAF